MLSQELLFHKLNAVSAIARLGAAYFDSVEVFVLLRDSASATLSAHQQWGFRDTKINRCACSPPFCDRMQPHRQARPQR